MYHKTPKMKEIETKFKADIRDILIEYYYEKNLTLQEVGKILGIDISTVSLWLLRLNLPPKKFTAVEIPRRNAEAHAGDGGFVSPDPGERIKKGKEA